MEYAGNVTQESNEQIKAITTCIYGWWRLYDTAVNLNIFTNKLAKTKKSSEQKP